MGYLKNVIGGVGVGKFTKKSKHDHTIFTYKWFLNGIEIDICI